MKKTLYILSVAALILAGCTKENVETYYEEHAAQLEVSSQYVIFGADGGSKTVLVASSAEGWTWTADGSWYDVVQGDGSLEISADANETGANRYSTLTIVCGDLSETISVAQAMTSEDSADLSADETANCYIAPAGGSYRFKATVKGNGQSVDFGGIGAYVEKYGLTIASDDIMRADLLWEAVLDGDLSRQYNVIDQTPVYSNGYVYFSTGTAEGNALIAVKDAHGSILWSWHIWVTDEVGETEGNNYHWQDRNLGAGSGEPGDVINRGLLYQWGRKDPFLPSLAPYGADNADVQNTQVGDGTGEWHYTDCLTRVEKEAPGNIQFSAENPMSVLLHNGQYYTGEPYSWYLTTYSDDLLGCLLWGDSTDLSTYVKSPFDPCPPGYNVPVENAWISANNELNKWTYTAGEYGWRWTGGDNAFYPYAGGIWTDGDLENTGILGCSWSSAMYGGSSTSAYNGVTLNLQGSTVSLSGANPIFGFPVRCMRID